MNAWSSVLVAFMDSERTTGLSWRSWLYPERQTAVTWAASDSSRSMTAPRSRAVSEMATWVPSIRTSWQSTLSSSWLEPSHSSCDFAAFRWSLQALSQALMSAIHAANLLNVRDNAIISKLQRMLILCLQWTLSRGSTLIKPWLSKYLYKIRMFNFYVRHTVYIMLVVFVYQ